MNKKTEKKGRKYLNNVFYLNGKKKVKKKERW